LPAASDPNTLAPSFSFSAPSFPNTSAASLPTICAESFIASATFPAAAVPTPVADLPISSANIPAAFAKPPSKSLPRISASF
jgi:hypothetical protein